MKRKLTFGEWFIVLMWLVSGSFTFWVGTVIVRVLYDSLTWQGWIDTVIDHPWPGMTLSLMVSALTLAILLSGWRGIQNGIERYLQFRGSRR